MKNIDLMTGDWVYVAHNGKAPHFGKVTALLSSGAIETEIEESLALSPSVEPIPLTPAILEKNGFSFCTRDGGFYLYATMSYGGWEVEVIIFNADDKYRNNQLYIGSTDDTYTAINLMECNYIHQLQHALRLCGIEKEITI